MARRAEPETEKNCRERVIADIQPRPNTSRFPQFSNLIERRRRGISEHCGKEKKDCAEQSNRAAEINDTKQRSENKPVRPARAMRENDFVRKPEKSENSPARVLNRLRVQIWTEHQTAEKKRSGSKSRE